MKFVKENILFIVGFIIGIFVMDYCTDGYCAIINVSEKQENGEIYKVDEKCYTTKVTKCV